MVKGLNMKKCLTVILSCLLPLVANAKIETVNATGYGKNPYTATIDAIDNAVRQSNPVSIKHDRAIDLSSQRLVLTDGRDIDAEYEAKHTSSGDATEESSGSVWSKLKFWSTDSDSEKLRYRNKGGTVEFSDESIQREVQAKYQGVLEGYQVVSTQEQKDGTWQVSIAAQVKKLDEYKSPDLVAKAKYTVAIVPSDNGQTWQCISGKKNSKAIEEKIIDNMSTPLVKSKKLTVVERDNINKQLKELSLLGKDLANEDNLNKLKQIKIADYLLIVTVDDFNAATRTKEIQLTGEKITTGSANLSVSYKLIETATMEILSMNDVSDDMSLGAGSSCNGVVSQLSKTVGKELVNSLLSDI
jgi:curli biogenesis system outer membrane secretion channel CsgG